MVADLPLGLSDVGKITAHTFSTVQKVYDIPDGEFFFSGQDGNCALLGAWLFFTYRY